MKSLFYLFQLFLTTVSFLSWIPIPKWGYTSSRLYRMGIFFPLVGAILGGLAALVLISANLCFPYPVSVALTLLIYGWVTGAFHEDALADVADGMGGNDPQTILTIMRDSCIGTYGSFALISTYVLRFAALSSMSPEIAVKNLIAYAAVSRMAGVLLLTVSPKNNLPTKSMSHTLLFSNQWTCFWIGLFNTLSIVVYLVPSNLFFIPFLFLLIPFAARTYFLKRIGAITGDCAGFVIHVTETVLYLLATLEKQG